MLKKTIKYTDYNDQVREEDFYFNINEAEAIELELSVDGGVSNLLEKIAKERDGKMIIAYMKKMIRLAYGEKSLDGKRFMKSEEISDSFTQSEAYNVLLQELCYDAKAASAFVTGILPKGPIDPKKFESAKEEKSLHSL